MKGRVVFTDAFAGVISCLMTVIASISYATLIFSGAAAPYLQIGIVSALVSATVIGLVVAFRSSSPVTVAGPDANISAVLALIAAGVVTAAGGTAAEGEAASPAVMTLLWIALAGSTLLTGVFLFVVGRFRLGAWIRFIPFPVVGGFLAGTGWLLVRGSFKVMCGVPLTFDTAAALVSGQAPWHWLPGAAFAVALLLVLRRWKHFLVMPCALVAAMGASHAVIALSGIGYARAMEDGWLLAPFPGDVLIRTFTSLSPEGLDPSLLLGSAANLAALVIITAIVILLNAASVELTLKRDLDLDRELRVNGLANILAAPFGGMTGCLALSRTILNARAGATTRIAGVVGAALCGVLLALGAKSLGLFPRPVLGGLLLYLGLSLLVEWVWDGWSRLSRFDFFLVVAIIVIIAAWGFLAGVGIGLVIACMLFAFNYSRTGAVRQVLSGARLRSNVERSIEEKAVLSDRGGSIHVVQLQGYIFFGTAHPLLQNLQARIKDAAAGRVRWTILDFSRVSNLDSSSILCFSKLLQVAGPAGVTVIFTGLGREVRRLLEKGHCIPAPGGECLPGAPSAVFPDLDHAMGWCEDRILEEAGRAGGDGAAAPSFAGLFSTLFDGPDMIPRLLEHLDRMEVDAGFVLFEAGSPGNSLFFVESGLVTASILLEDGETRRRLGSMGAGTVVGEMGLYLGGPRSATVRAERPCVIYRLSSDGLAHIEDEHADLASALHKSFVRLLAGRLLHADEALRTAV